MKSLQAEVIVSENSLFMVVFGVFSCSFSLRRSLVVVGGLHLIGKPPKNTFEKVPFLLVRPDASYRVDTFFVVSLKDGKKRIYEIKRPTVSKKRK